MSRAARPAVIEVRGVEKTFRVPTHRVDSLKERATNPFGQPQYRELRALQDVSFDVVDGEFFGIVGRNGSGKSTLLKVLASIYRADAGRIRMAGRLAPFIELGVGFNTELTARDNVVLNGVMMGLTRREAQGRLDAVLDFAELGDFVDLKLKNYSSGMMVRLAFAAMVQADADIMLIDEVLAVGDAAFARKCMDVFEERRRLGRTLVLVTHDMATVQDLCDRALLLDHGQLLYVGEAGETARRYYRMNFGEDGPGIPDVHAKVVSAQLVDEAGHPTDVLRQGQPIAVDAVIEARRDLLDPIITLHVQDLAGNLLFTAEHRLAEPGGEPVRVAEGQRVRLGGEMENPLQPGRYVVDLFVFRRRGEEGGALQKVRLADFEVAGSAVGRGVLRVGSDLRARVEERASA